MSAMQDSQNGFAEMLRGLGDTLKALQEKQEMHPDVSPVLQTIQDRSHFVAACS